jgi:hypothetical protein
MQTPLRFVDVHARYMTARILTLAFGLNYWTHTLNLRFNIKDNILEWPRDGANIKQGWSTVSTSIWTSSLSVCLQVYNTALKPSVNYVIDHITQTYSSLAVCHDVLSVMSADNQRNSSRKAWYHRIVTSAVRHTEETINALEVFAATTAHGSETPELQRYCTSSFRLITTNAPTLFWRRYAST